MLIYFSWLFELCDSFEIVLAFFVENKSKWQIIPNKLKKLLVDPSLHILMALPSLKQIKKKWSLPL